MSTSIKETQQNTDTCNSESDANHAAAAAVLVTLGDKNIKSIKNNSDDWSLVNDCCKDSGTNNNKGCDKKLDNLSENVNLSIDEVVIKEAYMSYVNRVQIQDPMYDPLLCHRAKELPGRITTAFFEGKCPCIKRAFRTVLKFDATYDSNPAACRLFDARQDKMFFRCVSLLHQCLRQNLSNTEQFEIFLCLFIPVKLAFHPYFQSVSNAVGVIVRDYDKEALPSDDRRAVGPVCFNALVSSTFPPTMENVEFRNLLRFRELNCVPSSKNRSAFVETAGLILFGGNIALVAAYNEIFNGIFHYSIACTCEKNVPSALTLGNYMKMKNLFHTIPRSLRVGSYRRVCDAVLNFCQKHYKYLKLQEGDLYTIQSSKCADHGIQHFCNVTLDNLPDELNPVLLAILNKIDTAFACNWNSPKQYCGLQQKSHVGARYVYSSGQQFFSGIKPFLFANENDQNNIRFINMEKEFNKMVADIAVKLFNASTKNASWESSFSWTTYYNVTAQMTPFSRAIRWMEKAHRHTNICSASKTTSNICSSFDLYIPLTPSGYYLLLWPSGTRKDPVLLYIPYMKYLIIPSSLYRAGGLRSAGDGNKHLCITVAYVNSTTTNHTDIGSFAKEYAKIYSQRDKKFQQLLERTIHTVQEEDVMNNYKHFIAAPFGCFSNLSTLVPETNMSKTMTRSKRRCDSHAKFVQRKKISFCVDSDLPVANTGRSLQKSNPLVSSSTHDVIRASSPLPFTISDYEDNEEYAKIGKKHLRQFIEHIIDIDKEFLCPLITDFNILMRT